MNHFLRIKKMETSHIQEILENAHTSCYQLERRIDELRQKRKQRQSKDED